MTKKKKENTYQNTETIPNKPLAFLWYSMKPFGWIVSASFLMAGLGTFTSSFSPFIFKKIIDGLTFSQDPVVQLDTLIFWGSVYVTLLFFMWFFWRASGFIGMRMLTKQNVYAYQQLYKYTLQHSHNYFTSRFSGSVSNKIAHASDGVTDLLDNTLWGYFERLLGLIIAAGLMVFVSWKIGAIFLSLIMILVVINVPLVKFRKPYVIDYANQNSKVKGISVDVLSNISAVRQHVNEQSEFQLLDKELNERRNKDITQWQISEWTLVLNNLIIVVALGSIIAVLTILFKSSLVTIGDIVLVLSLLFNTSGTLVFIGNAMAGIVRRYGEIQEGLEEVLVEHEIVDVQGAKKLNVSHGSIDWSNVMFKYEDMTIFENFNLAITPGQRVGLVGHSGAGKSTFVSLLLRQHDIHRGEILIDGQNIAMTTQESLRSQIAIVPQEPILFHRSIRENIAYGKPDATDAEIIAAAEQANAHDFIMSLPNKYETLVGERGVKLSGGQKQRVAIARAMLKDAPILLLDEATSALDSESEVAIQKALEKLMEGRTVIAIAHRLSTLRKMDRIIVMEDGRIIEDGTHEGLAKQGGVYQRLWEHQAGGFLLE